MFIRNPQRLVAKFHKAFSAHKGKSRDDIIFLRRNLIEEEFGEVKDALIFLAFVREYNLNQDILRATEDVAKELADLLYVVYGTADALGIPLSKVFKAVHRSNMSKLGPDGKPVRREDGKILKGDNYQAADIGKLLHGKSRK